MKKRTHPTAYSQSPAKISHEAMLSVMDSIDALVYVADMQDYKVLFLNRYGREIFGDVVGKLCWNTFQKEQAAPCSFCTNDRLVDAEGKPTGVYNWEFQNTVTGRWYDIRDRAINWPDGRLVRIEIATDITEKKFAHDELRDREQLFNEAQKVAHIGVYLLDIASGLWKSSPVLDEIFGIDDSFKRDVEGWAAIVHPDERQGMIDYFAEEVLANKSQFDREYRIARIGDQQERWVYGRGELKFDQSGNPVAMLGAIQDITDRKRAKEALAHSHDLMQYVIAHNQSAVAVHDKDMKYIYVSDEYLRQYNVKEMDVIGKHHYDVFPDLPQKWRDVHQRVLAGAVEGKEEDPYVREDGTVDWTRWECRPWYESDGSIGGLIVYTEVITDRKNIEIALQESEARLAEAQHISHVGNWDWNPKEDTLIWSEENWAIMGIPRDKSPSFALFMEYIHPDDRELVSQSIAAVLEGSPYDLVFRMIRSDGIEIYIHGLGEVEYDAQGKSSRMYGTLQDITERMRTEQALRSSEEELRKSEALYHDLVETAQDLIWQCDAEGRYIYLNKAWEDVFGYKIDEMLGRRFSDFQTPEYIERDLKEFDRLLRGNMLNGLETVHIRKDGRQVHLIFKAKAVYDADGNPVGTRGTAFDITEKRKLEQQLLQAQKIESLGQLAGGVAHDFNNILTAVRGYTELAMAELTEGSTAYLELQEAQKSTKRAVDLTRQLLLSSRKGLLQQNPVDVTRIVLGMKRLLNNIIGERYALKTTLEKNPHVTIGDESNIEQALMNLVINARDSMPEGGEIVVATNNCHISTEEAEADAEARPGDFVCISVMDTGSGLDEEIRARIFDPFFSTKGIAKGSGLGLSVVHGVATQHHGWVDVESEPGNGSVFTIHLPVLEADIPGEDHGEVESGTAKPNGGKVLLVEDEQIVRDLAEKILARNGYEVHCAVDAEEARSIFSRENGEFDIIFSDVVLPGEDGFSMCRDLQSQKPSLGIIMASGYSETFINPDEIKEKGFLFLQKPYNLDVLLGALEEAVRTSRT